MVHHTELSHFRTGLHFRQVMNVFVYTLHYFYQSGCLDNTVIHGVNSTELPCETNYPLCTVKIKGKKIRIYSDPDCDCGKRRSKRDKSHYVIGYRLHTLTAINPSSVYLLIYLLKVLAETPRISAASSWVIVLVFHPV